MPTARVLEFCDSVAAAISTAWTAFASPVAVEAPNAVNREYAPDIGLTPDQADTLITGRQIYVFPTEYGAPELLDRAELGKRFACTVVIVERYGDDPTLTGAPPKAWMDERVYFTEQVVYKTLRNPLTVLSETLIPAPEEPATVDIVYDLATYVQHRAFWSQVTAVYQELEEYH